MCIAVTTLSGDETIELLFVLERIYQRRDGGAHIGMDMLVKNVSDIQNIGRVLLLVPFSLVGFHPIQRIPAERRAEAAVQRLRDRQTERVRLCTPTLLPPTNDTNWAYHVLPHVKILEYVGQNGKLKIKREHQDRGSKELSGYVKRKWDIKSPDSIDIWTWLFCAANNIAAFELVAPIALENRREHLQPGEAMWIRVEIDVPPYGYNAKSWIEKIFAQSLEYRQTFKSPNRVYRDAIQQLQSFEAAQAGFSSTVIDQLANAQNAALKYLQSSQNRVVVHDWRTLLYREYGVAFEHARASGTPLIQPVTTPVMMLPPEADPPGARRVPLPMWLHPFYARKERTDIAYEFFFGTDFDECSREDDFIVETVTRSRNRLFSYVSWLGLVLAIVSVILSVIALLR